MKTVTLWRPVGPAELQLIRHSGMKAFPPRLPEQPIFYPVTSIEYARRLAFEWNRTRDGGGFVTEFEVLREYLAEHAPHVAGGVAMKEYWIPADQIGEFNEAIVGSIRVIESYAPSMAA